MICVRVLSVSVLLGLVSCARTQPPPPGQPGQGDAGVVVTYYYLDY